MEQSNFASSTVCPTIVKELERLRSLPDGSLTALVPHDVSNCDGLVVAARYHEDVTWLLKARRPVAIVHKRLVLKSIANAGGDASSYLWFLSRVRHEVLPEWVLMMHAHEHHWHHPTSQLYSIGITLRQVNVGFLNINHNRNLSMLHYHER